MQRIVVNADSVSGADLALSEAAEFARIHEATVLVLHVEPLLDAREVFDPGDQPGAATEYLEALPERYPELNLSTRQVAGDPASAICRIAAQARADLIVLSNTGMQGTRRRLRASLPRAILRDAPCSVFLVGPRSAP
jgi:nucleotide-binding universal stress UspA family protein